MQLSWSKVLFVALTIGSALVLGCSSNDDRAYANVVPAHFPPMSLPEDYSFDVNRVNLGRSLFFERKLSRFEDASCGTCHIPALAFTDGIPIAKGTAGRVGLRNTPSLANAGYLPVIFYDGGVPTIERQMIAPFGEHAEFDFPLDSAMMRLSEIPYYQKAFDQAFGAEISTYAMSRAIAAYLRTLISAESAYDAYLKGDEEALSESQKRGKELFFSDRLQCSSCHTGVLLSDYGFHHNGLYMETDADPGRGRVTRAEEDMGKFKTPSLRNVARTAPYMHDGRFDALDEVVMHYARGEQVHPNQDPRISGFDLTAKEKSDLIAFLTSFTDESFGTK
jgi:cytochrome c peroxidase